MNNKELLLRALADVIKERRGSVSITQLSLESDVSKSILFMIEKIVFCMNIEDNDKKVLTLTLRHTL